MNVNTVVGRGLASDLHERVLSGRISRATFMAVKWALLFSLALAGHSLAQSGAPTRSGQLQTPFYAPTSRNRSALALTEEVKEYIEKELDRHGVRGMSIAVVHNDWQLDGLTMPASAVTEYGNFGIRSEEGDPMTSDVRLCCAYRLLTRLNWVRYIDILHHRVQYESIRHCRNRSLN